MANILYFFVNLSELKAEKGSKNYIFEKYINLKYKLHLAHIHLVTLWQFLFEKN